MFDVCTTGDTVHIDTIFVGVCVATTTIKVGPLAFLL